MNDIRDRALELSGLSYERAFAIDELNLISNPKEGIKEELLFDITEDFFERIYSDENDLNPEFRDYYRKGHDDPDELSNNYSDWMVQRLGGEDFYTNRRGFPALLARHSNMNITSEMAETWLAYMKVAIDFVETENEGKLKKVPRNIFEDHLRYCAYYLVAGAEITRMHVASGSQDYDDLQKTFADLKSTAGDCPHITLDVNESSAPLAVALPNEKPLYKEDAKVFAKVNDKMRRGQLSGIKPSEERTWLYLITVDGMEAQWIEETAIKTTLK